MYNEYGTYTVGLGDNYHNNTAYLETLLSSPYQSYISGRQAFNRNTHPIDGPYIRTSVPFRSDIVMLMADNANPITLFG